MSAREIPGNQFGQYEVNVEGKAYILTNLTPMAQIRIARLLGPALLRLFKEGGGEMLKVGQALRAGEAAPSDMMATAYPALAPILEALASLSEEAVETIIKTVVRDAMERREAGGVLPVWDRQQDRPADKDLTGLGLLTLVGHSLAREFGRVSERYAGLVGSGASGAGQAASL